MLVVITHLSRGKRLALPSSNKGALINGNAYDGKRNICRSPILLFLWGPVKSIAATL